MTSNILWKVGLATPTLIGAMLMVALPTTASEVQPIAFGEALSSASLTQAPSQAPTESLSETSSVDLVQPAAQVAQVTTPQTTTPVTTPAASDASTASDTSIDEILNYSNDNAAQDQVTSISQLSDVQPTDWAFQALQSLVERYGCIAGYPDGTYRGQSAMTRYEFAAGLNACLDRISELIAASTADLATKEDLATLQRLQEEFAAELATLRGRVDNLEARVSELEENQFSTTTKLRGETIFAAAVPFSYDDQLYDDSQAIGGYRVRLNFDTSFTGEDLLRARLQATNFNDFDSLPSMGWQWGSSNGSNDIVLDDLLYTFPVGDNVQVIIGANSIGDSDFVASTVSPFDSSGQGSLTDFGTPGQYQLIPGGTGAGAIIQLTDNLSFDFGYAAGEAGDSSDGAGLFNGDYGAIAQFTYLSDFVDVALMYSNSYANDSVFLTEDRPQVLNIYGGQVNFKIGDSFQFGGGVAYAPAIAINRGDYDIWTYQATIALTDLGGEGNMLGLIAGAPLYGVGFGNGIQAADLAPDFEGGYNTPIAVEGFYRFRVNDNISITPGLIWLTNPGGNADAEDSFAGAIRTTFSF